MKQHNFDIVFHVGDLVYNGGICTGDNSSWNQYIRAYFYLYRELLAEIPFYPTIGNHELIGGGCGRQAYTDVFYLPENTPPGQSELYYSFDWGNAHFVVLDVYQSYEVGSQQYNWLLTDLVSTTQPRKFVFFHEPPYSSGPHNSSLSIQTHLVPLFEAFWVDVVFSGHDHSYERTCPILNGACTTPQGGGVVYYVTGGGGVNLYQPTGDWFTAYSEGIYHFIKVKLDECRLQVDAINTQGVIFDRYQIDQCRSPQLYLPIIENNSGNWN